MYSSVFDVFYLEFSVLMVFYLVFLRFLYTPKSSTPGPLKMFYPLKNIYPLFGQGLPTPTKTPCMVVVTLLFQKIFFENGIIFWNRFLKPENTYKPCIVYNRSYSIVARVVAVL